MAASYRDPTLQDLFDDSDDDENVVLGFDEDGEPIFEEGSASEADDAEAAVEEARAEAALAAERGADFGDDVAAAAAAAAAAEEDELAEMFGVDKDELHRYELEEGGPEADPEFYRLNKRARKEQAKEAKAELWKLINTNAEARDAFNRGKFSKAADAAGKMIEKKAHRLSRQYLDGSITHDALLRKAEELRQTFHTLRSIPTDA